MTTSDVEIEGGAWLQAHEALARLAAARAGHDFEEGQRLRAALVSRAHAQLGYGSFVEYIERLFGYSPRLTYEKLRVAEALEQLDGIAMALRTGQLSWSVVRELTRVATPETEREWLTCAVGLTAREPAHLRGFGRGLGRFSRGDGQYSPRRRYAARRRCSAALVGSASPGRNRWTPAVPATSWR